MDESADAVTKVIRMYFFMAGPHGRGTMRLRAALFAQIFLKRS
jgi:hypothetical protein